MTTCDQCGERTPSLSTCPTCDGMFCTTHRQQSQHNCVGKKTGLGPLFRDRHPIETGEWSWWMYVIAALIIVSLTGLLGLIARIFEILLSGIPMQ